MNDFSIYIPTFRRVKRQLTWRSLPPEVRAITQLVCVSDEADALRAETGARVLVQPASVKTISAKRQWIVDQCRTQFLCMLDDDLRLFVRDSVRGAGCGKDGKYALKIPATRDISRLFVELRSQLDQFAHAGVSMRMGNQSRMPGWHTGKRMVYVLAYDLNVLRQYARFDAVAHREDMHVTLELLTHGFQNSVSYEFAADQTYASSGGEKAAGRDMRESSEDAEKLASAFPDFVKVSEKAYKSSTPRKEVIVQWSRAWNRALS